MRLLTLSILSLPLLLTACDKPAVKADDQPVLRVGATPDGYPHYFKEGDTIKGFSTDILNAVAGKIHYKVEWVTSDWVGVLGSLETGKVDTVGNFADTPERRKKYDYSAPYYYSAAQLAVSKNNTTIHGLQDMKGKTVAADLGSNYGKVLKEFDPKNEIRLVTFEGMDVVVNSVAQGKVDAYFSVLMEFWSAWAYIPYEIFIRHVKPRLLRDIAKHYSASIVNNMDPHFPISTNAKNSYATLYLYNNKAVSPDFYEKNSWYRLDEKLTGYISAHAFMAQMEQSKGSVLPILNYSHRGYTPDLSSLERFVKNFRDLFADEEEEKSNYPKDFETAPWLKLWGKDIKKQS